MQKPVRSHDNQTLSVFSIQSTQLFQWTGSLQSLPVDWDNQIDCMENEFPRERTSFCAVLTNNKYVIIG